MIFIPIALILGATGYGTRSSLIGSRRLAATAGTTAATVADENARTARAATNPISGNGSRSNTAALVETQAPK